VQGPHENTTSAYAHRQISHRQLSPQPNMSSYSPSSSSVGGGGGAFFLTSVCRSRGHVGFSFSHGCMHSRSKIWSLWHGNRTTRGCESNERQRCGFRECFVPSLPSRKALEQIGQLISGFKLFFGTRSSCSMNSSLTPLTWFGGCSALLIRLSTS